MAIAPPPSSQDDAKSAELEALFREARELERRRRRRRLLAGAGAVVVIGAAAVGFSGGGGGRRAALGSHQFGGAVSAVQSPLQTGTGTANTYATVCMMRSQRAVAGDPPPGYCVIDLGSSGRYQCPTSVDQSFGADVTEAATSRACHRLAPPSIPANWRPTLTRLRAVKECLRRAGVTASGGSLAGFQSHPGAPVGALLVTGPARPSTISFYLTVAQADEAYGRTHHNVVGQHEQQLRQGSVLMAWDASSGAKLGAFERACVRNS